MKNLTELSQNIRILLGIMVVLDIGTIIINGQIVFIVYDIQKGVPVDGGYASAIDNGRMVIQVIYLLAFVSCAIYFAMWTHRAYANLAAGKFRELSFTPGKAAGSYFIPIVNLYRPFKVMSEISRGSKHLSSSADPGAVPIPDPDRIVHYWWTVFVISEFVNKQALKMGIRAEELDEILDATYVALLSNGLDIIAAVIAIKLVKHITQQQDEAIHLRPQWRTQS